jgi:hypothetical protein
VELKVELPVLENKLANFVVEFESEETPATKVVEELDFKGRKDEQPDLETSDPQESEQPSRPLSPTVSIGAPISEGPQDLDKTTGSVRDSDSNREADSISGTDSVGDAGSDCELSDPRQEPLEDTDRSDEILESPLPIKPEQSTAREAPARSSSDQSKPQFEFDSAEPEDLEISHKEFDELSKPKSNQVTMGSIDLERVLVDANESETISAVKFGLQEPEVAEEDETGQVFGGGICLGKYWRWNGEQAIAALQHLIDSSTESLVYRSEVNQLTLDAFEEISLSRLAQQQPAVFLISSMNLLDLRQLVRKKRWEDRIGHPQAVTMFLTFLPKRMLSEFFDAIDACVLIHENDVELLRVRKTF